MRQTRFRLPRRSAAVGAVLAVTLGSGLAVSPTATASDVGSQQWYLAPMQASAMWKVATGKGITVAVVDGGVNAAQPDLRGRVLAGSRVDGSSSPTTDPDNHGTDMAMLIAGDGLNGTGVRGLAPGATILAVAHDKADAIPQAIRYAADHGAKIINVSQGNDDTTDPTDRAAENAAVKYAVGKGALLFASVGNEGKQGLAPEYPARSPGAVGVAAIDQKGDVADFSNAGPGVSLAAPGMSIPSLCLKGESGPQTGYCLEGGTSASAALASASAALIWSAHPSWTNNQVLRVMIATASRPTTGKVPSDYLGYGGIRPRLALLGGHVDPGPANVNPLFPHLFDKSAGKTPAPSASAKPAAAPSDTSSGNAVLWVAVGAAVVVVAAVVVLFVVRRRRA